jgi:hypothetical protein
LKALPERLLSLLKRHRAWNGLSFLLSRATDTMVNS